MSTLNPTFAVEEHPVPKYTKEEALACITTQTRLTKQDIEDLLNCKPEDLEVLVRAYKESNQMPTASSWETVLRILKACAEIAGFLAPIVSVLGAVYHLATATRNKDDQDLDDALVITRHLASEYLEGDPRAAFQQKVHNWLRDLRTKRLEYGARAYHVGKVRVGQTGQ